MAITASNNWGSRFFCRPISKDARIKAPATLLAMTRVKARSLRKGLLVRSAFVIAMLLLAGGAIALSSQGIFAMKGRSAEA